MDLRRGRLPAIMSLILVAGCSGLPDLTDETLAEAEGRWRAAGSASYRLTLELSGDRVETGTFEIDVREGAVVSLTRNGMAVDPGSSEEYTVDGLFVMLHREREMSETPALLGAPAGYAVYLRARFDPVDGRVLAYDRSVGGTSNRVGVKALDFTPY